MADIKLKCAKCGKEVAVSEFAKIDGLRCSCGEVLRQSSAPPAEFAKHKHIGLTFKTEEQIAERYATPNDPAEWRFTQQTRKDGKNQPEPRNIYLITSWLVFIVLAGVMGFMRYSSNNPFPDFTHILEQYGIVLFIALYLTIILRAFKDTVFQGLLCLLPFYPFYYIVMICDDFYLRAVVAGMLVGIGQDSLLIINGELIRLTNVIQAWIAHGG